METNEYLLKLQKTEVEILDEIVRVCRENNIEYYLVAGTLLGAVRHKGFIPWDDDLDVTMPRADYERFLKLCPEKLGESYFLHSADTDAGYWLPFAKIRKKGTVFIEKSMEKLDNINGIYVDIFPLDYTDSPEKTCKAIRTKVIKRLSEAMLIKAGFCEGEALTFSQKCEKLMGKILSMRTIQKLQISLMKKQNKKCSKYFVNYGSNYRISKQIVSVDLYKPAAALPFEGKEYSAPGKYREVLEKLYGDDYMELPPEEKRITHEPVKVLFGDENEEV